MCIRDRYESIGLDPCEGALKASALSEEFRYDTPQLPEPEAKAAAVRITLGSEVVDEFVMEGGETDGGA